MFDYSKAKASIGSNIIIHYIFKGQEYNTSAELYDEIDPTYMYSDDPSEFHHGPGYKIRFVDCEGFTRHYSQWEPFYKDEVNDIGKLHIIQKQKDDTREVIGELYVSKIKEDRCVLMINDKKLLFYKNTPFSTKSWFGSYRKWDDCVKFNGYLSKLTKKERAFVDEMLSNKIQIENSKAFENEFKKIITCDYFLYLGISTKDFDKIIDSVEVGKLKIYPIVKKTNHFVNENNDFTNTFFVIEMDDDEYLLTRAREWHERVY